MLKLILKSFMISTLPWIEKYRPKVLDDVISHGKIINTLKTFIENKCLPHLLFYGPSGTGKTSVITACAKELYGKYYSFMVMELNASDDRGIEVVRNRIKQFVTSKNVFFGKNENEQKNIFKLVILDEIDAMTSDAQAILRKIIEEYTYNTRFCLICNYIQNIIQALQSRCTKFRFAPLNNEEIRERMIFISNLENIKLTNCGIETILKISNGDMRKAINILQSVSMAYDIVNETNVNNCLGYPLKEYIETIVNVLINEHFEYAFNKILKLKIEINLSLDDIIQELHDVLNNYILNNYSNFKSIEKLNVDQVKKILDKMRIIEFNQSTNITENIQLAGLISIFKFYL